MAAQTDPIIRIPPLLAEMASRFYGQTGIQPASIIEIWGAFGMQAEKVVPTPLLLEFRSKGPAAFLLQPLPPNQPGSYPRYTRHPSQKEIILRVEADGRTTKGSFAGRFIDTVPVEKKFRVDPRFVEMSAQTGLLTGRSCTGQIEYWSSLGASFECAMGTESLMRTASQNVHRSLDECLAAPGTRAGKRLFLRRSTRTSLKAEFREHPTLPGIVVRIDKTGTRTHGTLCTGAFILKLHPES